jgi:hypothetical protein
MTYHCLHTIITLFIRKNLKTPKTNGVPLPQAKLCTMKYHHFSRRRKSIFYVRDPKLKKKDQIM